MVRNPIKIIAMKLREGGTQVWATNTAIYPSNFGAKMFSTPLKMFRRKK